LLELTIYTVFCLQTTVFGPPRESTAPSAAIKTETVDRGLETVDPDSRPSVVHAPESCYSLRDEIFQVRAVWARCPRDIVRPKCADEGISASGTNPRHQSRKRRSAREAWRHSWFHAGHDDALQGRRRADAGG